VRESAQPHQVGRMDNFEDVQAAMYVEEFGWAGRRLFD
jgi:hypothetical protein